VTPHYVLIQAPRREGVYVRCGDVDQCLEVVEGELGVQAAGTRITMFRKKPRRSAELLGIWRIEPSGPRRYKINDAESTERLIHIARNAYLYGGMDRQDVIGHLIREHGASRQDAVLASAAGKVLAREYEENPKPRAIVDEVHSLLGALNPDPIEKFTDGVWEFEYVGSVTAGHELLRRHGWKTLADSKKRFPGKTHIVNMRKGASGSPEAQIQQLHYGGKARVVLDTKP